MSAHTAPPDGDTGGQQHPAHGGGASPTFADRRDAGRCLAGPLRRRLTAGGAEELPDTLVLGLSRGGVPVAYEVARSLGLPLDVLAVRKLGLPQSPEIAMGTIAEQRAVSVDQHVVRAARITPEELGRVIERERAELDRCVRRYRAVRPAEPVSGRQVVVVDDGMATGGTAAAACRSLVARGAGHITVAVPVAPLEAVHALQCAAHAVVTLRTPPGFRTLDQWYDDFGEVAEEEVLSLLADAVTWPVTAPPPPSGPPPPWHANPDVEVVRVPAGDVTLHGRLVAPADARGLVVLAQATAGDHQRSESRHLAAHLEAAGVATLRLDLLTVVERQWWQNVRDVDRLTRRLVAATEAVRNGFAWLAYVGTRATAATVVRAAAAPDAVIAAVVVLGATPSTMSTDVPGMPGRPGPDLLVVPTSGDAPGAGAWTDDEVATRVCDWLVRQGAAAGRGGATR